MFIGRTHQHQQRLKNHINECVNSYTCYILVDEVRSGDYYASNTVKPKNKEHLSSQIVTVMICEKIIDVPRQHNECCLIHYLCTYPSMRERGYASTLVKSVFSSPDMYNKKVYCVTALPDELTRRKGVFDEEDLKSNDVWNTIASRKSIKAFLEKFISQRYKTNHTSKRGKKAKKGSTKGETEIIAMDKDNVKGEGKATQDVQGEAAQWKHHQLKIICS